MPRRIWANSHWEVAEDGMASLGSVDYFIPRHRLCELHPGREVQGVAMWPLQIADKSWAKIEPFLEAYQRALELLQPKGWKRIDVSLSSSVARERAFENELRRR
jgi:hypothetical protein